MKMDLSVCDNVYKRPGYVWLTLLSLLTSLNQIVHTKGDSIEVKLALSIPWQRDYLDSSKANTQQLSTNLRQTIESVYSSYEDTVTIEIDSFYQHNTDETGGVLRISSDASWDQATQSKIAYFISNYFVTNNNQIEVSGQIYDVTDGVYFVTSDSQILVDDLCFLYDGEQLCTNGGSCAIKENAPSCECEPNYEGKFCAASNVSDSSDGGGVSVYIIVLICAAALLVVIVIAAWLGCRSSKKEEDVAQVPTKHGEPSMVASSESLQSGGAPAVLKFPGDETVWLTESDQNLMQREGPKVLNHLLRKHGGGKKPKPKDPDQKTRGSVYRKRDEVNDVNVLVGSGQYQRRIESYDEDDSPRSSESGAAKPRKGILKSGWQYNNSYQNDGTDNNPYPTSFHVNPISNREEFRPRDQYEGAQTRVSVTDGGAPASLPPITEVDGAGDFRESFQEHSANTDLNY